MNSNLKLKLELLKQTKCQIYCLVRCQKMEEGKKRLMDIMNEHEVPIRIEDENRLTIVCGDLSKPQFGLSDSEYNHFNSKIDAIFHCGAVVNWVHSCKF